MFSFILSIVSAATLGAFQLPATPAAAHSGAAGPVGGSQASALDDMQDGVSCIPLGNALLLPVAAGSLQVNNIGSSGNDGVSIALPGFDGVDIQLEPVDLSAAGAWIEARIIASSSAVTSVLRVSNAGGNARTLSAGLQGGGLATLDGWCHGEHVLHAEHVAVGNAPGSEPVCTIIKDIDEYGSVHYYKKGVATYIDLYHVCTAQLGSSAVKVDLLGITSDAVGETIDRVDLVASAVPGITLIDVAPKLFGKPQHLLAGSAIAADNGALVAQSAGDDVQLDVNAGEVSSIVVVWPTGNGIGLPSDATLRCDVSGIAGGLLDASLGSVTLGLGSGAAGVPASIKFDGFASASVDWLIGGAVEASAPGLPLTLAAGWPTSLSVSAPGTPGAGDALTCSLKWPTSVMFELPGGGVIPGDEVRLSVNGAAPQIDALQHLLLSGFKLGDLTIADEGFGDTPARDIGFGNVGGLGGLPFLKGQGPFTAGSLDHLVLTNAAPIAPVFMAVSLSSTPVPFKGGTLCTVPWLLMLTLFSDASGTSDLLVPWPAGVPSGFDLFFQDVVPDAGAPKGFALSNAVNVHVP